MSTDNNHTIRVATYARVSTQEQATEGTSLDFQDSQLKTYCQSQGWTISNSYVDPGYSGKDDNRPGLKQLLIDAKFNLFEKVVVCKLDRMARNLRLMLAIEAQLREYQVSFTSIKESIDTSTGTGKMIFQMFGMVAEWEREAIIDRTKSGRLQRYREGCWGPGYPPFGYKYNRETKKLVIEKKQAGIVRQIFNEYVKGKSMWEIANILNNRHISPRRYGKGWRNTSVRDVLCDPIYKGTQVVNIHRSRKNLPQELPDTAIHIKVPAIVNEATWNTVQERRKNNKHVHPTKNDNWLLQGLITCGMCGYSFKTEITHGRRRYGCRGRLKYTHLDGSPRCTSPHLDADWLEQQVWQRIEDIINDPNKLEIILRETIDSLKIRQADLDASIRPIDERLAEIAEQKSKLAEDWVTNSIPSDRIHNLRQNLYQEEIRLRDIRNNIDPAQIEELERTGAMISFWENQLYDLDWDTETEDGQKVRIVEKPHRAALKIINLDDKELADTFHFPTTRRKILDMLQVRVVIFMDRIEIKSILPVEPIRYQLSRSNYMSDHYP